ncbi:MAG TPA: hypothetical protein VJB13_02345 [Candidatus Nanoarchaeia archaeon]|nr:hypothetical protein [Candidatus Nanoarchaeia archaeon]
MKPQRRSELLQKGWREEELRKADAILEQSTKRDVFFSKIVFWSALVVIVFANLLISVILIPFLLALYDWALYGIVTILALCIGFLYNFLITDIGLLETAHHRLASIIVPLIGMGNVIIMVLVSNRFIESVHLNNQPHSPWVTAAVFGVAFILPYVVDQIRTSFQN